MRVGAGEASVRGPLPHPRVAEVGQLREQLTAPSLSVIIATRLRSASETQCVRRTVVKKERVAMSGVQTRGPHTRRVAPRAGVTSQVVEWGQCAGWTRVP